jgi:cellulose synthase/poly-beta-1,6-N-acetylglucosamine synthase-like glycosyltransferase
MLLDMVPTYRDYDPDVQSTTPMVSIYIPAYNAKKTIGRAIQSALNQTYTEISTSSFVMMAQQMEPANTLSKMYGDHPKITIHPSREQARYWGCEQFMYS